MEGDEDVGCCEGREVGLTLGKPVGGVNEGTSVGATTGDSVGNQSMHPNSKSHSHLVVLKASQFNWLSWV